MGTGVVMVLSVTFDLSFVANHDTAAVEDVEVVGGLLFPPELKCLLMCFVK